MLARCAVLAVTCVLSGITSGAEAPSDSRDWSAYPMETGRFDGRWESLDSYQCPEWFRDSKFGIWAIIGPQCVPMQGDWYARNMYIQGHRQYEHHVKAYGHPSKFGYKDLIERFDPTKLDFDRLVERYKQAGAKYAVLLAVHHDNFDLWNSRHHEWNSVQKGPKRDLVGEFRDAARKHGLRFGVTTHLARSYSWLQTSHGSDKEGPLAGVPYDGADPKHRSLYHPPFAESARYPTSPPEAWERQWYLRVQDLIDQYRPDLMYFDGGYPFDDGAVGKRLVAHYYNANAEWNRGRNEAVMCIKKWGAGSGHGVFRDGTCVQDIERGAAGDIRNLPWQTDTCIGGWYYHENARYKTPGQVVHMLIDIVSKNGNLLLNIPLHPEGTIDEREEAILDAVGRWMKIHGEGIYGTRPWVVCGEGPSKGSSGHFNERAVPYTARDFRFTAKGPDTLYAFFMAWPADAKLRIQSLERSPTSERSVEKVELLGHDGALSFEHDETGLLVSLPESPPGEHAWALRVRGRGLAPLEAPSPGLDLSWRQTGTSIALLNQGKVVWQHVHDREGGKPYMRVGLLDGTELTRPWPYPKDYPRSDHVWHKALWWSWKFIDGINFWEEHQRGTDPVKVQVSRREDGSATIDMTVHYHLPDQPPLVIERRVITVSAPDPLKGYLIDWQATFEAAGKDDVVFNQNSYGGFAIRMAAEFCGDAAKGIPAWEFIRSEEPADAPKDAARWMAYRGTARDGKPAAIAMFSHPDNPRYPARWQTRDQYPYLNPSFTCREAYTLHPGKSLKLHYGVLIHPGPGDKDEIERAWKDFAATGGASAPGSQ